MCVCVYMCASVCVHVCVCVCVCVCIQLYRASDLQEEKVRILTSLGSVSDSGLIQRTLDFSLGVSRYISLYLFSICFYFYLHFYLGVSLILVHSCHSSTNSTH